MRKIKIYIFGLFILSTSMLHAQGSLSATAAKNTALRSDITKLEAAIKATSDSVNELKGMLKAELSKTNTATRADSIKAIYTSLDNSHRELSNWISHYEEPASDQPVNQSYTYLVNHKKSLMHVAKSLRVSMKEALKYVSL